MEGAMDLLVPFCYEIGPASLLVHYELRKVCESVEFAGRRKRKKPERHATTISCLGSIHILHSSASSTTYYEYELSISRPLIHFLASYP